MERRSTVITKSALLNAAELFDSQQNHTNPQWYYLQLNLIKLIL